MALFDHHAHDFDNRRAAFAPLTESLHLLATMVLHELGPSADVLCVGAGTGAELLAVAEAYPGWRFTAVDPSAKMLEVCERKVAAAGIADRCAFHVGTLDTLPPGEPFDGATSILVSQFLLDPDERRAFFREIADRLRPGGLLVTSDLATGASPEAFERMLDVWFPARHRAGMPGSREAFGRGVAVLPPGEIERLITEAGFTPPTLFHQAMLIHAWYARRGDDPLGVARRFNEAINAADLDALVALMSHDHRFVDAAGNAVEGDLACRDAWARFFASFAGYRNVIEGTHDRDGLVVMVGHSESTEPALDGPALWSARVRNGRVAEWRVYADTPEHRSALGLG